MGYYTKVNGYENILTITDQENKILFKIIFHNQKGLLY